MQVRQEEFRKVRTVESYQIVVQMVNFCPTLFGDVVEPDIALIEPRRATQMPKMVSRTSCRDRTRFKIDKTTGQENGRMGFGAVSMPWTI